MLNTIYKAIEEAGEQFLLALYRVSITTSLKTELTQSLHVNPKVILFLAGYLLVSILGTPMYDRQTHRQTDS